MQKCHEAVHHRKTLKGEEVYVIAFGTLVKLHKKNKMSSSCRPSSMVLVQRNALMLEEGGEGKEGEKRMGLFRLRSPID